MYVTAQRVTFRSGPARGVNAFLHRGHARDTLDRLFRQRTGDLELAGEIHKLTETNPGELVASRFEVPPGGNSVESFLDVFGDDDAPADDIARTLKGIRWQRPPGPALMAEVHGRVALRFQTSARVQDPGLEFEQLRDACLNLLSDPKPQPPLVALVIEGGGATQYRLDDESWRRVKRLGSISPGRPAISIGPEEKRDFEQIHGPLEPELVELVTGLRDDLVRGLGGLHFRKEDGSLVFAWPAASR